MSSPFGNISSQYASANSNTVGYAPGGTQAGYGTYHMNAGDFVYSLMPYMWAKFVPALRARGLPFKHILDVSETVAETGAVAKVTVAQNLTANDLGDGQTKILDNTPPLVAEVAISDDVYVSFGVTDFVSSIINGQPTLPAMVEGALFGLLNDIETQIVTDIIANVPVANVVGSFNSALTATTLSSAQSILVQNYAPSEDFYALVSPTPNGWDSLITIGNIVFAQNLWAPYGRTGENSPTMADAAEYGQNVRYLGGNWSQSQLVPFPTVSGQIHSSNVLWHPAALAVACRAPKPPTPGIGVVARNFVDSRSGIALQMSYMYNKDTLAEEMVLRTLIGDAPAQANWSALIKS